MRKVALFLAILLVLAIPIIANADNSRIVSVTPRLSFSGTTATCIVRVDAEDFTYALLVFCNPQ